MGRLYPGSYQVTARPVSARVVLPATATDPVEDPRSVSGWVSPGPGGLPRTSSLLAVEELVDGGVVVGEDPSAPDEGRQVGAVDGAYRLLQTGQPIAQA